MPELTCTGEDSARSLFHPRSFVCQHFTDAQLQVNCTVAPMFGMHISDDTVATDEMLAVLFQKARMNIQLLDIAARENAKLMGSQSFRQLRHDVTAFLFALWRLQRLDWLEPEPVEAGLRLLDMALGSIESMPCIRIVQTACRIEGNVTTSPAYHLLHGQLEWRLLRLAIRIEQHRQRAFAAERLAEEFQKIVQDLCVLSVAKYQRLKRVDMLYSTPFVCTCVKELWLLVQLLLESVVDSGDDGGGGGGGEASGALKPFWAYVNECLYRLRDRGDVHDELRQHQPGVRFSVPQKLAPLEHWTEFALWLVCGVARLHGFDRGGAFRGSANATRIRDNYELLDVLLGDFLQADPAEDVLRVTLFAVLPVLTKWWPPKTDVLLVLWEYFHKKLNSSFFLQGSAPSTLAVVK